MRKSKFSNEEILGVLDKLEKGTSMEDICKKVKVTPATIYNWKKKFLPKNINTDTGSDSTLRSMSLKELQDENLRLKQLVANLSLEKQDLIELLKRRG